MPVNASKPLVGVEGSAAARKALVIEGLFVKGFEGGKLACLRLFSSRKFFAEVAQEAYIAELTVKVVFAFAVLIENGRATSF